MNKVKTLDDLRKMRESLRASLDLREKSNNPEQMVQIKVAMATCGIAAGAKEVMSYFIEALDRERVDARSLKPGVWAIAMQNRQWRLLFPAKNRSYLVVSTKPKLTRL